MFSARSYSDEKAGAMPPKLRARGINAFALPNLTKSLRKEKGTSTDPFATLQFKGNLIKSCKNRIVCEVYIEPIQCVLSHINFTR